MPRPGDVSQPMFERGDSLAYGQATQANRGTAQGQEFRPQGDEQQFMFGPTDKPGEPITHGAPFGPGANIALTGIETPDVVMSRVADQIRSSPQASKESKAFADRLAKGY